jgi:spore germination protein GerM
VTVFLVRGNSLVKVRRQTAVSSGFGPVVSALLKPLTVDDSDHGLRTALPVATSRLKVKVSTKVATVWLPAGFDHLAVADQILAIGQIVFTLTANSDVTAVGFTNGSRSINVPDDHGRLVAGPVTRGDYAGIAPAS